MPVCWEPGRMPRAESCAGAWDNRAEARSVPQLSTNGSQGRAPAWPHAAGGRRVESREVSTSAADMNPAGPTG